MKIQLSPQQVAMMRRIDQQNQLNQYQQQVQQLGQQNLQQYGANNSLKPQGIIEGLATGLSGIVRRPLGMASKLVRGVADIGGRWAQTGDLTRALAESKPIEWQETDIAGMPTLTERENVSLANTPLEFGAGNALETLAWAAGAGGAKAPGILANMQAPGLVTKLASAPIFQAAAPAATALGRIGQAAKMGAIGGTMGGLGEGLINPETNTDLAAIAGQGVKGGLFGGAFGGGLQTVGEIGKAIKRIDLEKFGRGQQFKGAGTQPTMKSSRPWAGEERAWDNYDWIAKRTGKVDSSGLPIRDPKVIDEMPELVGKVRNESMDDIKRIWQQDGIQVSANDFVETATRDAAKKVGAGQGLELPMEVDKVMREMESKWLRKGWLNSDQLLNRSYNLTPDMMHDITQVVGKSAANASQILRKGNKTASELLDGVAKITIDNNASGFLGSLSDDYARANQAFSDWYNIFKPGLVRIGQGGKLSVTAGQAGLKQFAEPTLQRGLGRLSEIAGSKLKQVTAPETLKNVLGMAGNIAQKGIPIVAPALQNQSNWTPLNDQSAMTSQIQQMQDQLNNQFMMQQEQAAQESLPKLDRMFGQGATEMMLLLGMVGYTPQQALQQVMSNSQGTTSKALSASNVERLNEQKYVLDQLMGLKDTISQNQGQFNPITGLNTLQDLGATLGLDPGREGLRTNIDSLAQSVARAIEGARVTEADTKRYQRFLPSIYDSPQVAQAKLDSVIRMLQNRYQTSLQGYQAAGYNTGQSSDDAIYVPETEEEYALMSSTY